MGGEKFGTLEIASLGLSHFRVDFRDGTDFRVIDSQPVSGLLVETFEYVINRGGKDFGVF